MQQLAFTLIIIIGVELTVFYVLQWSKAMIFGVGCVDAGIEGEGCIDRGNLRDPHGEEHLRGAYTILLIHASKC